MYKLRYTTWAKLQLKKELGTSDILEILTKAQDGDEAKFYETVFKTVRILIEAGNRRAKMDFADDETQPVPSLDELYNLEEHEIVELVNAIPQAVASANGVTVEAYPEKKQEATQSE